MKVTHCLEVFVRFVQPNLQGVRLSYGQGLSSTHYLRIECEGTQLVVHYCDRDGTSRREVHYNFLHVAEYDCYGAVDPVKLAATA